MDDDIIRIIISTDNHLGFAYKDPIRCDDCFASFEEVLIAAKEKSADFVLLGGDLFHENKPTRKTLVSTLDLLRKYCTGENPVFLEILNDQAEVFKNTPLKKVNYEDPFQAISLPVFAIHGNHDDPSREGIGTSLSAMDVLSVSNLVNYIGKCEQVDDIEITPLLLRKGRTMIALYALGAVRDERLNRMWTQKHVKFMRPREDQGRAKFLNIFVLHQNRDYGRGSKNCVHESMIPDWMDIVIWGNEHECVPNLVESLVGTFRIYQPGSSVATSLCEGESSKYPKHYGMLEVNLEKFRLNTFPYNQIRSFTYCDISLAEEGLDPREPNIEEAMISLLSRKIKDLIREARNNLVDHRSNNLSISSSSLQDQPRYEIKDPQKVLIKLRVDHSGFPTINQQRFGTQFLGEVANPSDLILLTRKRRESDRPHSTNGSGRVTGFEALRISGDAEALSRVRVEDLVNEALENSHKQLGLLTPEQLSNALEDFVLKKIPSAIGDTIEHALHSTQSFLNSDKEIFDLCTDKEAIIKSAAKFRDDSILSGAGVGPVPRPAIPRPASAAAASSRLRENDDDMELQDDDNEHPPSTDQSGRGGRGRGRGRGGAGRATTSRTTTPKSRAPTTSATATSKSTRGRGKTKTTYRVDDDDDDEIEIEDKDPSVDDDEDEEEFVVSDGGGGDGHDDDDDDENVLVAGFGQEESIEDSSDSDRETKKKGRGKAKAKAPPKPKAPPPKKAAPVPTKKAPKATKPVPVAAPRAAAPSTSSGPRILASGRSQRRSQESQLSMNSSVVEEIEIDSEEERYQTGKRNRSGVAISQNHSVDLTGDDDWSNNSKKPLSSSSLTANTTSSNGASSTSIRKPPTQLKW